jgi:hypothetical protein
VHSESSDNRSSRSSSQWLAVAVAILLGGYLLVTSTVTLSASLWTYDVKRILELCLLPLIFAVVLLHGPLRDGLRDQLRRIPRWLAAALGLILALGVLSAVRNSNSAMSLLYSLAEVSLLSLLVLAALCVAACRQAAGTLFDRTALLLLALVAVAVGLQELLGVLAALNSGVEFHPRVALLHFSWPRFYNQVQSWSIPVIAALPLVFPGKPLAKFFCVAALALEWYVVVATGGRGSMIGVGGALLIAAIFLPAIRKTLIQYQISGLLGAMLIYGLVVFGHQQLAGGGFNTHSEPALSAPPAAAPGHTDDQAQAIIRGAEDGAAIVQDAPVPRRPGMAGSGRFLEPLTGPRVWTSSGRIAMWRGTLQDARTYPLLGIGPMNYACTGPLYRAAHPHSFPLQFLAEWGIPALLLLLPVAGFLLLALFRTLRIPQAGSPPLAGFLATALLAAAIHACLSGVLVMPASQVAGVLVGGWLLGTLPPAQASPRHSQLPASMALHVALLLGLALSIALLAFARQEIAVSELRLEQTAVMDRGIPRLWQNGKVCRLYREAGRPALR